MKVAIISVADERHMTMISIYIEYLQLHKVNYDIIRTNRYDYTRNEVVVKELSRGKEYIFSFNQSTSVPKIKKIRPFFKFSKIIKELIKKNGYDFLIIWNENTGLLLFHLLTKMYRNKFILNIRDEFNHFFLSKLLDVLVEQSAFATTPSLLLHKYENQSKILLVYNKDYEIIKYCSPKKFVKKDELPIRITFLGTFFRASNTFLRLVNIFKNDKRFCLQFFGDGFDSILKKYAEENDITNVITGGAFPSSKTAEYLNQTDIINSYYNNGNQNLKCAAGVKESYSPMLYIPAIVDEDTYWGKISMKYGFSFLVNNQNEGQLPDLLFNWYNKIDFEKFKQECDIFNTIVTDSNNLLFQMLDQYVLK